MIDAHVHIWRLGRNGCTWPTPELDLIHHDHVLTDVAELVAGTGVGQVILVQSQPHDDDTPWLLAEAAAALSDELDPHEDQQATPAMRRHLAKVLLARCVATLLNRPDLQAGGSA